MSCFIAYRPNFGLLLEELMQSLAGSHRCHVNKSSTHPENLVHDARLHCSLCRIALPTTDRHPRIGQNVQRREAGMDEPCTAEMSRSHRHLPLQVDWETK